MIHEALPTDLHWAELHVDTLALHDDVGRMLRWNAVPGEWSQAPILFFAATAHGNVWRVRAGLPDALTRELCRLAAAERTQPEADADPERLPALDQRIADAFADSPRPTQTFRGYAFCFPDAPRPAPEVSMLREEQLGELEEVFPKLAGSLVNRLPCAVRRDHGRIVSACYAATMPGPRGGLEAGVDTVASHRGRGCAPRVVAPWAAEVARGGLIPLYSAARDNRASLAVARRLGLRRYAATLHIREAR